MAWSYKDYTDNEETKKAKEERERVASQRPKDFIYGDYTEGAGVISSKNNLDQHMANKPGEYNSSWQQSIDDTLYKILNREDFSYDLNGDMLYQQYKDQYTNQGKMAMMDTMGQAAAMTGGYGNSYAQSVGQQTYQGYLQQLNDKIPELYQLALDQYNREGDELYKQYGLFSDREEQDYGRYRDSYSDWQTDRDYYTNIYYNESDRDYNRYVDDRDFAYGQHRDDVSDWQADRNRADQNYYNERDFGYNQYSDDRGLSYTQYTDDRNFNEQQRQYNESQALEREKFEEQKRANRVNESQGWARVNGGGTGGGGTGDDDEKPSNDVDYSGWSASDWNEYFASIRQSEGSAAAEAELNELIKQGVIPKNMIAPASIGARGRLGH